MIIGWIRNIFQISPECTTCDSFFVRNSKWNGCAFCAFFTVQYILHYRFKCKINTFNRHQKFAYRNFLALLSPSLFSPSLFFRIYVDTNYGIHLCIRRWKRKLNFLHCRTHVGRGWFPLDTATNPIRGSKKKKTFISWFVRLILASRLKKGKAKARDLMSSK